MPRPKTGYFYAAFNKAYPLMPTKSPQNPESGNQPMNLGSIIEDSPVISLEFSKRKCAPSAPIFPTKEGPSPEGAAGKQFGNFTPFYAERVTKALEYFLSILKFGTRKKIVGDSGADEGDVVFPAEFLFSEKKPLKFKFSVSGKDNSQVYFLFDILSRFSKCKSEKDLLKRFLKDCGHFLFYFKAFCRILLKERCRARISLDVPGDKVLKSVQISVGDSLKYFRLLKKNPDLIVEKTKIVGRFMGFDYSSGKWILKTEDNREFFGTVERLSKLKTKTVVIQEIVYSCIVAEKIVGFTASGREKISRKLAGFFPLKK